MSKAQLEQLRRGLVEDNPDAAGAELIPSAGRDGSSWEGSCGRFEQFRSNLRAEKYQFLQNKEQHLFIWDVDRYQKGDEATDNTLANRKAGKEQTTAVKQRVKEEEETLRLMQVKVADLYAVNRNIYAQFYEEVQKLANVGDTAELSNRCNASRERNLMDIDEANTATDASADELRMFVGDQQLRRRNLEVMLDSLQGQARRSREESEKSQKLFQREAMLREAHEKLAEGEWKIGHPVINYDESARTITLSVPENAAFWTDVAVEAVRGIEAPLRTISFEYGADGKLAWAEAHPHLELQACESSCFQHDALDDIARLVAAVWEKMREIGEQAELRVERRHSHGGA